MATKRNEYVETLLELMAPLGSLNSRAMFGGYGIYLDGLMIGLVADDELFFKVDKESQPQFEAVESEPFVYEKNGKPMQMSYWKAPEIIFDEPEEMLQWGRLALGAALRQKK